MALEAMTSDPAVAKPVPFLKWAGGKRWFVQDLPFSKESFRGTYFEPFLGSAAVFFSLAPAKAVLSDSNQQLIETYRAVAKAPKEVAVRLAQHDAHHASDYYYRVRGQTFISDVDKAAQFIYLNRVCWNGLYRVNRAGKFNVPIGTKTSALIDSDDFVLTAKSLEGKEILCSDFEQIIDRAGADDLVFADPPYTVRHKYNGFVKYNEQLFSWEDQLRLRNALLRASDRGAKIVCTNADHASVRAVYGRDFRFKSLLRYSSIAGSGGVRGNYSELLITNCID